MLRDWYLSADFSMITKRIFWRLRHEFDVRKQVLDGYTFIHINKCGGSSVEAALGLRKIHDTAMQRRAIIGAHRWAPTPSFAVVRDPYARVASLYRYRVKTNQTGMGDNAIGLNDWVQETFGTKNPKYYDKPLMFAPCVNWISDDQGTFLVDLVVKLENIADDWPKVQKLIGRAIDLPRRNRTKAVSETKESFLDANSIAHINRHFARDFDVFGYEARI